jgi:hypothetical protein
VTRLLVYEPSWRRIEDEVARRAPELEVLVIDRAGAITLNGAAVSLDEARPDAVWANHEVFMSPAARGFFTAALKSPNLRWVQSAAAGFDNKVFGDLAEKGVTLTTSHGQAVGMADYVLAGVLDHFQGGPARRAAQGAHAWRRDGSREISGTTGSSSASGRSARAWRGGRRPSERMSSVCGATPRRQPWPTASSIWGVCRASCLRPMSWFSASP